MADPALGLVTYDEADFKKCWHSTRRNEEEQGTALLLEWKIQCKMPPKTKRFYPLVPK